MDQKSAFLEGEGNSYFRRNQSALDALHSRASADPASDPILRVLRKTKPASILEVGCANGWRLDAARQHWGATGYGVDPSAAAICNGSRFGGLSLSVGTAVALPGVSVECVVFGFCLYLCDRADLHRIAAEADRVLIPGGHIVILDFLPDAPHAREYAHYKGLSSFKMDYAALWEWHPVYRRVSQDITAHEGKDANDPNERLAVTVLHKS